MAQPVLPRETASRMKTIQSVMEATVVVGNPPFPPHKKTDDPSEKFVDRALEALRVRGTMAMVVPESLLVKPSKKKWRSRTLKDHSLRAVITLPSELFQPYAASTTAIIILEKGVPHDNRKRTFFCRITNDGYRLKKNVRVEQPGEQLTAAATAYRQNQSLPGFCTWHTVSGTEWSPGNYIEGIAQTVDSFKAEIDSLTRSQVAFHALFAPQLIDLRRHLDEGDAVPIPYENNCQESGQEIRSQWKLDWR